MPRAPGSRPSTPRGSPGSRARSTPGARRWRVGASSAGGPRPGASWRTRPRSTPSGTPRAWSGPPGAVPAEPTALLEAHRRLDAGDGTVWVADSSQGWFGGADRLRWVQTDADAAESATTALVAQLVRVMPFLEGVPCSIHGIVLPTRSWPSGPARWWCSGRRAATTRGRRPDGVAAADAAHMRAFARRVGATCGPGRLRRLHGGRRAHRAGFRPTELNPRYGAMLATLLQDMRSRPTCCTSPSRTRYPCPRRRDLRPPARPVEHPTGRRGLARIHGPEPRPVLRPRRRWRRVAGRAGRGDARVTGSIGPGATRAWSSSSSRSASSRTAACRARRSGGAAAPRRGLDLGVGALHAAPSVR